MAEKRRRRTGREGRETRIPEGGEPAGGGGTAGEGEVPTVNVTLGGDGGGDGGGSPSGGGSSTSGGGGGTSDAKAKAEEARRLRASLREERIEEAQGLRDALISLGLPVGPFKGVIKRMVRGKIKLKGKRVVGNVGSATFLRAVSRTKEFRKRYPGIKALTDLGMSLSEAIRNYPEEFGAYTQAAHNLGMSGILTPEKIAMLIKGGVSPEEFGSRLTVLHSLQSNAATLSVFNEVLKSFGKPVLDQQGQFEFLMGEGSKDLYDIYEAVQLSQLGLSTDAARNIARALGVAGQPSDLSAIGDALSALRSEAGQEFSLAGVTQEDLILASVRENLAAGPERDRANFAAEAVEQVLRNRKARVQARTGQVQPQVGGPGGPLLPSAPRPVQESV